MNTKKFIFAALGYIIVTFIIAATWHLILFKDVYDNFGIFTREKPIIPLGIASMIIQGLILSFIYPFFSKGKLVRDGLVFGLLTGFLMASSAVLAEAGKNLVSSLPRWIILETIYYLLQFSISGLMIALIYGKQAR